MEKVRLSPGASQVVSLDLPLRAFAWFDTDARRWQVTGGTYRVEAGFSAADLEIAAATLPR